MGGGGGLKTDQALVPGSSQGNQNQAGLLAPTSPHPNIPHCPLLVSLAWGEAGRGQASAVQRAQRVNPMLLGMGFWVLVYRSRWVMGEWGSIPAPTLSF